MPSLRRVFPAAGVAAVALLLATPASAWKFEEFMNAHGDSGIGIVQEAEGEPGIVLAFGCDGDRWRQLALLPEGASPLRLAADGTVSLGFDPDRLSPDGTWKVRNVRDERLYFAPAPTQLMGRMYREAMKDEGAVLYVKVRPAKKSPRLLRFPVAGLRGALAEHLWKPCKLDVYFGDPQ